MQVTQPMIAAPVPGLCFVLAGGGSLGAIQVGMLEALIDAGLRPSMIVGVSAGALNGAYLAHDPSAATVAQMASLWRSVSTRQILGLGWRSVLGLIGMKAHLADPSGLRRILLRTLPYRTFAEARVPLHLACTELGSGEEVLLSSGSVIEAVLASAAIPGVFPAVRIGTQELVDGVVASGTPIGAAVRLGASRLLVLPCGFACVGQAVARGALGRAMHAITLLGARQLRSDFERFAGEVRIHIVPPLCPMAHSAYDYSHGDELIDRGRASTLAWLQDAGLERTDFPAALTPHAH